MQELTWIRIRTLTWLLLFPVTFLGLFPWWLNHRFAAPVAWEGRPLQWVGVWLVGNGIGLVAWCVNLFNVAGRGTPLPLDPPTRFVMSGPYRYVRNPMMLGMFLIVCGEAAVYRSSVVLLYSACLAILAALFVRYIEEPQLERRFGEAYLAYTRQVPRWIPRWISGALPWKRR